MVDMAGIISKLLSIRKKKKAKKPDFVRQEGYRYEKLDDVWRRPRGRHSKLRKCRKPRGKKPSTGFGSPKAVKGMTKQGFIPVHISNVEELRKVDSKKEIAIIRSSVGKKKRMEIVQEAEKLKIKVSNAYRAKLPGSK